MKKKFSLFFVICFILILQIGQAQEMDRLSVSIEYYNKRIYYLNQTEIIIKVSLVNDSSHVSRFKIADNRYFTIDFEVMNPTNEPDLRRAIKASGLTRYRIATDAGVDHAALARFIKGTGITLDTASRLCDVLGMELVKQKGR